MDSIEITIQRTAAATAVAARALARPDAHVATICGCGNQGRAHAAALRRVLPIEEFLLLDVDPGAARRLAAELEESGLRASAASDLAEAVSRSQICVTCTPSRSAFLPSASLKPGTFLAAVGADSAEKQELEPALLAEAAVVVDSLAQCAEIGELHHALRGGWVTRDDVRGELGEVLAGRRIGRMSPDEIVVFDSTGIALEDVAAASLVYERAIAADRGARFRFSV